MGSNNCISDNSSVKVPTIMQFDSVYWRKEKKIIRSDMREVVIHSIFMLDLYIPEK